MSKVRFACLTILSDDFKKKYFHRVQRVEDKGNFSFNNHLDNYKTRRINLTFRYVPEEYIYPLKDFPPEKIHDIAPYLDKLAEFSLFWKNEITK